jgi:ATP adenylyltransferase
MDYLWTPWRFQYVSAAPAAECLFCVKAAARRDEEHLVVHRGADSFVLLNLYPYTSGHLMVAPYAHVATLEEAPEEALAEMMRLARQAEKHLRTLYRPRGLNVGFNIGECAGAGVADHLHMHVLPRWPGDTSFVTTIGETRIVPEDLAVTYEKLSRAFRGS